MLPFGTLLKRFVIAEPLAGPPKLSSNLVRSDVPDTATFVCWSLCSSKSDFVGVTISRPPALSVNVTSVSLVGEHLFGALVLSSLVQVETYISRYCRS